MDLKLIWVGSEMELGWMWGECEMDLGVNVEWIWCGFGMDFGMDLEWI